VTASRRLRLALGATLVAMLACGLVIALGSTVGASRTTVTAYFENSTGLYPGDEVRILGVPVGKIKSIEPMPRAVKITFRFDDKYRVPADTKAVILSPTLVTARFIQLTPAYTGGPQLQDNAVISRQRTAVPVEWDDLRTQLAKLNKTLQPTQPGGVSTLGAFVDTVADNVRGQGAFIRDAVIKLSESLSILGDQSGEIIGTVKNLAVLVSALRGSSELMSQLNHNLAAVTALVAEDPNAVGAAVANLNTAVRDVRGFLADNREAVGTTSDKLAEVTTALNDSLDDVKQALHVFPSTLQNFSNIYQPAHNAIVGALSIANFANPIQFICGAIQAASRLNAEQSAKLCVQYLAPIIKNRQYNFLPVGFNGPPMPLPVPPFALLPVTATARPNEVTFSEDWMRPDYVPPSGAPAAPAPGPGEGSPNPAAAPPLAATTNPADGLQGMMVAPRGGS
jgi:phospholipid/cholesterol/gamma-HCH transport system substrate-binding protein